ncbi:MAG: 3-deoxy-manno-octulosonate cytidylyltransferase [Gammaproteobacteria bacterium]|nr:3-deoxy-manno-octulosonate cytidylyltransferase [Gammaproteobacteria bacterium]
MIPCSSADPAVFRVVIPARYDSTRLPGKVLCPLAGRPMLQWVHQRASAAGAREVLIAADDERIAATARRFGAQVELTAREHASGSDRIAEVARRRQWASRDIVVNLQADEPLMRPVLITQVAELLAAHPRADIATLAAPLEAAGELHDPNVVKVVCALDGSALYFSRAAIPCERDAGESPGAGTARRHLGLYAYRVDALLRFTTLPPGPLEQHEKLEQLRALEHGLTIQVAEASARPGRDVNTPADVARASAELKSELAC